jgi:hypothetical protein
MIRALVASLLLVGCGTDSLSPTPDLASPPLDLAPSPLPSPPMDLAPPPGDLAYAPLVDGGGFKCGTASCGGGNVCCVVGTTPMCQSSCPDGGFVAQCRGPQDCGGNPCCVTLQNNYSIHDVSCAHAQTDCVPSVDTTTGSGQDRACNVDGDCTAGAPGTNLPNCCTNSSTGQHVCFNRLALVLVPGFTCP